MATDTTKPTPADDVHRLKSAFDARRADGRPISHSVAVAYRKVIAERERKHRERTANK